MSERKAINKWYPPDYDPSKVPKKQKNTKKPVQKVRLMAPFSMRCLKCNEYIAHSRKFNARKEDSGERYLSMKIWRFYITCPMCNNSISFKTNPKTAGFVPDQGAVRNYELTKNQLEKEVATEETPEQILERLEREEQENKKFQLEKEKRAKNPFWKHAATSDDKMENLEEKMVAQMRQHELETELESLQSKNSKLQEKGEAQLQSDAKRRIQQSEAAEDDEHDAAVRQAFQHKRAKVVAIPKPAIPTRIEVKRPRAVVTAAPAGEKASTDTSTEKSASTDTSTKTPALASASGAPSASLDLGYLSE